jgi:hypothetical protein
MYAILNPRDNVTYCLGITPLVIDKPCPPRCSERHEMSGIFDPPDSKPLICFLTQMTTYVLYVWLCTIGPTLPIMGMLE